MPAATAIAILDRPSGHFFQFTFTLDAGSVLTLAAETQTVAVPGAQVGDLVVIKPLGLLVAFVVSNERVTGAGAVAFTLQNVSGGTVDPASMTFTGFLFRGSTMGLR